MESNLQFLEVSPITPSTYSGVLTPSTPTTLANMLTQVCNQGQAFPCTQAEPVHKDHRQTYTHCMALSSARTDPVVACSKIHHACAGALLLLSTSNMVQVTAGWLALTSYQSLAHDTGQLSCSMHLTLSVPAYACAQIVNHSVHACRADSNLNK